MKHLTPLFIGLALLLGIGFSAVPSLVMAADEQALCEGSGGTWTIDKSLPNGGKCTSTDGRTLMGTIQQLTDVLIFLIGAIAVVMIIVGGIRYVVSAGDQAALTSAKNTILYAIIGLLVAIMAFAVVRFIYTAFNIK